MKIYIVTRIPFPNGMAPANRIKCYAKAIKSQGVDVEILVYTRTEAYGSNPKNTCGNGFFDNIPFKYIGGTPFRNRNVIIRRYYDYKDKKDCLKYLKKNLIEKDIVLGYNGQDVDYTLQLIDTAHSCNALFIRDLCEFPYGTGVETPNTKKNREKVITIQAPKCDGYICISKALYDYITPHTSASAINIIVPILVDYKQYELEDKSANASFPFIFHAGTLTEQKDGVLGMLEAFGNALHLLPQNVKFVLTGNLENAKAVNEIKSIIDKFSMKDRILFTGYLSDDDLKKYLSEASLVIINKYVTRQNEYCFSTKLGEYLAAAKPVIITKVGEAMNWLKEDISAYMVEPGSTKQLTHAIVDAFSDNDKRKRIAESGRELCQQCFDYKQWGKVLVDYFTNCIQMSKK